MLNEYGQPLWQISHHYEIHSSHIELLTPFDDNATPEIFQQIFGEHVYKHLWEKYTRMGGFICTVYRYLDDGNRKKLCEYLNNQGE